jgi:hypothetical protein
VSNACATEHSKSVDVPVEEISRLPSFAKLASDKSSPIGRVAISIDVDDLNIFGDHDANVKAKRRLSEAFEMTDLGKLSFCIGVHIKQLSTGLFLHQ